MNRQQQSWLFIIYTYMNPTVTAKGKGKVGALRYSCGWARYSSSSHWTLSVWFEECTCLGPRPSVTSGSPQYLFHVSPGTQILSTSPDRRINSWESCMSIFEPRASRFVARLANHFTMETDSWRPFISLCWLLSSEGVCSWRYGYNIQQNSLFIFFFLYYNCFCRFTNIFWQHLREFKFSRTSVKCVLLLFFVATLNQPLRA